MVETEDIEVGEFYSPEDLPENSMNNSGKLEWVSDDTLVLSRPGGLFFEFEMAVKCTAIGKVDENGDIEEIDGNIS